MYANVSRYVQDFMVVYHIPLLANIRGPVVDNVPLKRRSARMIGVF